MSEEMIPVHPDEEMNFNCSHENICFNDCCRDLSQALTPYDILRMKNNVGIPSDQFLREYTSMHIGPESGLPVLEFKPNPQTGHACPFVTEKGCSVYPDRPGSCRMYPLARAVARSRQTGQVGEFFALIQEDHCKGFGKKSGQTVRQWLEGQDVQRHNMNNDRLMELISMKNQILPGRLEPAQVDWFYLALYDLDTFKEQMISKTLPGDLEIPQDVIEKLSKDDEALLAFGIQWIQYMLFGKAPEI